MRITSLSTSPLILEVAAAPRKGSASTVPWGGLSEGPGQLFTGRLFLPEPKVTWLSCRSRDKSREWKWWARRRRNGEPGGFCEPLLSRMDALSHEVTTAGFVGQWLSARSSFPPPRETDGGICGSTAGEVLLVSSMLWIQKPSTPFNRAVSAPEVQAKV